MHKSDKNTVSYAITGDTSPKTALDKTNKFRNSLPEVIRGVYVSLDKNFRGTFTGIPINGEIKMIFSTENKTY